MGDNPAFLTPSICISPYDTSYLCYSFSSIFPNQENHHLFHLGNSPLFKFNSNSMKSFTNAEHPSLFHFVLARFNFIPRFSISANLVLINSQFSTHPMACHFLVSHSLSHSREHHLHTPANYLASFLTHVFGSSYVLQSISASHSCSSVSFPVFYSSRGKF